MTTGRSTRECELRNFGKKIYHNSWVKVFRITPEFRILRPTFPRIRQIIVYSLIYFQNI